MNSCYYLCISNDTIDGTLLLTCAVICFHLQVGKGQIVLLCSPYMHVQSKVHFLQSNAKVTHDRLKITHYFIKDCVQIVLFPLKLDVKHFMKFNNCCQTTLPLEQVMAKQDGIYLWLSRLCLLNQHHFMSWCCCNQKSFKM